MKTHISPLLLALIVAPFDAASACDAPSAPPIPDGSTSTLEEMVTAQDEVRAFQARNEAYLQCLDGRLSVEEALVADGDGSAEYRYALIATDYNAAIQLEEELAATFNSEIANYKAGESNSYAESRDHPGKSMADAYSQATTETYNIDLLQIRHTYRRDASCSSGFINKFELTGVISPDSTFAMTRLLERFPACKTSSGYVMRPSTIALNSGGGLLSDGYALGRELRRLGISATVEPNATCASSCAVAFLGGKRRIVSSSGTVMFHAPYFDGENAYGKRDISCDVGREALAELNAYYREMTDADTGDRLFERTMWYCSASDGWVITGAAAAELYGIATEK